MSNWSDLPLDIWTNVFDAMGNVREGLESSKTCKTFNKAWYQSRHWSSETKNYLCFKVTPERIPGIVRMFEKAKWNAQDVSFYIKEGIFPKQFAKKILKNLNNSTRISIHFEIYKCVDLTSVVKALPAKMKSLIIDAEAGWTMNDKIEFPNTLERIRMINRIFKNTGHEKPQDGVNLKYLEIINSHPFYIIKPCCLKSLDTLETLWLINTNRYGSVDLNLSKFPVLKKIHMHDGSCSLLKDGSELHIIGFAKKHHVRCMARRPWGELLKYFDREPRGDDADVHYMNDDDEGSYAMDIDGQSVFVNDFKTPIDVNIDGEIIIKDVTKHVYGSDYEESDTESECISDSDFS
jgi:hypothetical protein